MMDPDAPVPPGVWEAPADEGRDGTASESEAESESSGAPQRRPAKRQQPDPSTCRAASSSDGHSEEAESSDADEGTSLQHPTKRVCVDSAAIRQDSSSPSPAAAALPRSTVEHKEASEQPAAPPAAVTAAMWAERCSAMFPLDAQGAVASGMPQFAERATMGFIDLAYRAVCKLCEQHGKALSKAYGNFDRIVGLGWLVADALGAALVSRETAYTIGIKLRKLPDALKADQAAARKEGTRAAGKLAPADPQRLVLKQKAAEEELRLAGVTVDVDLPRATPAAPVRASGSRKSAQKKAEPSLEERADASEQDVLAAKKALDRANTAEDRAGDRFSTTCSQLDRISARAQKHFAGKCSARKKPHCCIHWSRHVCEGAQKMEEAMLAWKDTQISALQRHIEWRDALDAQQELEQELFHEQNGRYIRVLERAVEMYEKRV